MCGLIFYRLCRFKQIHKNLKREINRHENINKMVLPISEYVFVAAVVF